MGIAPGSERLGEQKKLRKRSASESTYLAGRFSRANPESIEQMIAVRLEFVNSLTRSPECSREFGYDDAITLHRRGATGLTSRDDAARLSSLVHIERKVEIQDDLTKVKTLASRRGSIIDTGLAYGPFPAYGEASEDSTRPFLERLATEPVRKVFAVSGPHGDWPCASWWLVPPLTMPCGQPRAGWLRFPVCKALRQETANDPQHSRFLRMRQQSNSLGSFERIARRGRRSSRSAPPFP